MTHLCVPKQSNMAIAIASRPRSTVRTRVRQRMSVLVEHERRELFDASRALGEVGVLGGDEDDAVFVSLVVNVLQLVQQPTALLPLLTGAALTQPGEGRHGEVGREGTGTKWTRM